MRASTSFSSAGRSVGRLAVLLGCGLLLVGCNPEPGDGQPIAMTVHDGILDFVWCGDEPLAGRELAVDYRLERGDREDVPAARATGDFALATGEGFSTAEPPDGARLVVSREVPMVSTETLISVYVGPSDEETTFIAQFLFDEGLRGLDLPGDGWVYPDGTKSVRACGARR